MMKLKPVYQLLLLFCITLGIYAPTLSAPFNSLDDQNLVDLLLNQTDFSFARHLSPGGTFHYYRPLVTLSFEIDKYVGGLQEPFMHLFNVLLHTLNVSLVWLLARRFGRFISNPSDMLSFIAALLFAIHPINTEAVNWIMARTDLLAGTFVFASLLCLLRFLKDRSLFWGVAGAVCLLLGALCKETALFMAPGACYLLICHSVVRDSAWRLRWILPALYGCAIAVYFTLRSGAFTLDRGLDNTVQLVSQLTGISTTPEALLVESQSLWFDAGRIFLKAVGFYTVKLFQPIPLNFAIHRLNDFYVIPGILLIVALGVLLWQRRPVGWLFLVSASIAVSALCVVFTQVAWAPIAERYMYVPSAPFAIGLVYVVGPCVRGVRLWRVSFIIVPLLIGTMALATASRNFVWQDNLTLYQDAVRQSPGFARAREHFAAALREQGRNDEARALLMQSPGLNDHFALLNSAATHWLARDYYAARDDLLQLLENPGEQEVPALEMLIKMTTEHAQSVQDDKLKRAYYEEVLDWLIRIREHWPNGFVSYRIGRVHLILNNRVEAQRAFAEAAERFSADSLYREPALKLARDLAE
jgi:tetratricopeptide (TPR) repeat protein